jgi:hypothetical protein
LAAYCVAVNRFGSANGSGVAMVRPDTGPLLIDRQPWTVKARHALTPTVS